MKILVVGGGAREHAVCWSFSRSKRASELFAAPGNAGTAALATNLPEIEANDVEAITRFAVDRAIDLVFIGPEAPLAAGVVERGISALCELSGAQASSLVAVIGPHIGDCCYEVDAPVLTELQRRFGDAVGLATRPTRVGHHRLSLAELVIRELELCGVAKGSIGRLESACTRCDPVRFHSHRRDGERAGRLVHHISVREIA